jgi:outer membrane protein assembly factor BamD
MIRRSLIVAVAILFIPVFCVRGQPNRAPRYESPFFEEPGGKGKKIKDMFRLPTKAPVAEEELYEKALAYFSGKPTYLAKKNPERAKKYADNKYWKYYYTRVDYDRSIELFQKLIYDYPFTKHLSDADFYIAESHYKMKDYEIAIQAYQDFLVRHPRDPRVEYVYFQIAMSHWDNRRKNPLKDQSETEAAVESFKLIPVLFPAGKYREDAEKHLKEGYKNLADREIKIGNFYFKKKEFWSASLRYHNAWSNFPESPQADYAQYREALCFQRMGRKEEMVKILQDFVTTYPNSKYVGDAQKRIQGFEKSEKSEKNVEKEHE